LTILLVGDDEPYPGPLWQPTVWDGRYPNFGGDTGDIYINRYRDPPLYYVFFGADNSQPVQREEIAEWVTGGLMSLPLSDQNPVQPGLKLRRHTQMQPKQSHSQFEV
jgi:hypothetical protein